MQHTFHSRAALFGGTLALVAALVVAGVSGAAMRAMADEAGADEGPAVQEVYGQLVQRTPDGASLAPTPLPAVSARASAAAPPSLQMLKLMTTETPCIAILLLCFMVSPRFPVVQTGHPAPVCLG